MKKLRYSIKVNAPAAKVYDTMLGLTNKASYEAWTSVFSPGSTYEGAWNKGDKILFVGPGENGEKGGMVAEIAENISNSFVSIRHYGLIKGDEEITEGPEVAAWANSFENYTFVDDGGYTLVHVDLDTTEDFEEYMNSTYPQALEKLKQLCE